MYCKRNNRNRKGVRRMYKIESDTPIHKFASDYMNCAEHETCEQCACASDNDYFICALLSFYRDALIEKIHEIS